MIQAVLIRMALPGLLSGLRKPLARAIHIPQKDIEPFAAVVQMEAARLAKAAAVDKATPEMWTRAVEAAYVQYITTGITVQIERVI